jgi:hypothetical protein
MASSCSLILIDEVGHGSDQTDGQLGRGTSPAEGVGLSHAIAEDLIKRKVRKAVYSIVLIIVVPGLFRYPFRGSSGHPINSARSGEHASGCAGN